MNVVSSAKVRFEELRSIDNGNIGPFWSVVGSTFANPVRLLKVTNTTDIDVLISYDGATTQDIIPAKSAFVYDYATNKSNQSGYLEQSIGDGVYVMLSSATLPTVGKVYVTVVYASQV